MKNVYEMMEAIRTWLFSLEPFMRLYGGVMNLREKARQRAGNVFRHAMATDPGIDGILVTVGLCIIALLLCVVMKNSLAEFIQTIVSSMTKEATNILSGTRA